LTLAPSPYHHHHHYHHEKEEAIENQEKNLKDPKIFDTTTPSPRPLPAPSKRAILNL
jgi:hypothetical protein